MASEDTWSTLALQPGTVKMERISSGCERRRGDVVGYSRMMGADEAGTLDALKAMRAEVVDPKVAAHQGRVVKLTGDVILGEFPSVVNAVACAAAIQMEMRDRNSETPRQRRFQFRIGVDLGDVIVEGDDIYGDGVNVAVRLQSVAK